MGGPSGMGGSRGVGWGGDWSQVVGGSKVGLPQGWVGGYQVEWKGQGSDPQGVGPKVVGPRGIGLRGMPLGGRGVSPRGVGPKVVGPRVGPNGWALGVGSQVYGPQWGGAGPE